MESVNAPSDPAADLADAEAARRRLAAGLRLPSGFYASLGVAVAVHIGSAVYGLLDPTGERLVALVAGALFFVGVAAVQVVRFRRINGVQVDGLVSRAVLGTSTWSSLAEAGGLAGGFWAAHEGLPWLAAAAAVAGGAAYAFGAHRWWRGYQADPAGHVRAESRPTLVAYGLVAVVALVALLVLR